MLSIWRGLSQEVDIGYTFHLPNGLSEISVIARIVKNPIMNILHILNEYFSWYVLTKQFFFRVSTSGKKN